MTFAQLLGHTYTTLKCLSKTSFIYFTEFKSKAKKSNSLEHKKNHTYIFCCLLSKILYYYFLCRLLSDSIIYPPNPTCSKIILVNKINCFIWRKKLNNAKSCICFVSEQLSLLHFPIPLCVILFQSIYFNRALEIYLILLYTKGLHNIDFFCC